MNGMMNFLITYLFTKTIKEIIIRWSNEYFCSLLTIISPYPKGYQTILLLFQTHCGRQVNKLNIARDPFYKNKKKINPFTNQIPNPLVLHNINISYHTYFC